MSNEHIQQLKEFIFNRLREEGFTAEDKELDRLIFQTPSTLRLRKAGFFLLNKLYDSEEFMLEDRLSGRELLTLKKHIGWPYWLPQNQSRLVLFTVKESFYLKLQGGDVKKWLAQIYDKNSQ